MTFKAIAPWLKALPLMLVVWAARLASHNQSVLGLDSGRAVQTPGEMQTMCRLNEMDEQ